ncbi:hypothetical protein Gotur_035556 [Gossypium turneri]
MEPSTEKLDALQLKVPVDSGSIWLCEHDNEFLIIRRGRYLPQKQNAIFVCDKLCDKLKRISPFVPLVGINGQPFAYAPPSLTIFSSTEWWESLEWDDHPNFHEREEKRNDGRKRLRGKGK